MTDEQIVKAWEKCIDVTSGCCGDDTTCPYCTDEEEGCAKCFEKLRIDVLALIKRQQAEIKELQEILGGTAKVQSQTCAVVRVKAVREFAEKVLALFPTDKDFTTISRFTVKQFLKEMTEEKK